MKESADERRTVYETGDLIPGEGFNVILNLVTRLSHVRGTDEKDEEKYEIDGEELVKLIRLKGRRVS